MMTNIANDRINAWMEKAVAILLSAIVGMVCFMYFDQRAKVESLQQNVTFLYQDKVSKADLKEEIERLRVQNEGNKSDIVARIDLLTRYLVPQHNNSNVAQKRIVE